MTQKFLFQLYTAREMKTQVHTKAYTQWVGLLDSMGWRCMWPGHEGILGIQR